MEVLMALLAAGSLGCVAVTRSRAWFTEWTAAVLMSAGMVWIVVGGPPVYAAAVLLASGMIAGRGPDRVASLHRGLTAVAMAGLALTHAPMGAAGAMTPAGMHQHGPGSGVNPVLVVVWAVALAAVAVGCHVFAGERGATGLGGSRAATGSGAGRWARRAEVVLMSSGLAVMALPV